MSEVSVIGGGITGLAVAHLINQPVSVFEASKSLGGILRDLNFQGDSFFSGCQYFNGDSSWLNQMGLEEKLFQFDHIYASYTDLFGKKTISDSFAGPVYEGSALNYDKAESFSGMSLDERCNLYPSEISSPLKNWLKYIGIDVNITHHSAITGFQASRIYPLGEEKIIAELKEKNVLADVIYGLPRNVIGLPSVKAFLPDKGFNNLFDDNLCQNRNIKYSTSSTVNCDIVDDRLVLKTKNGVLQPNLVIWTADPTKLVSKVLGFKLESQKFPTEILVGFLDSPVDSPFYIQVYSDESKVLRIYLYNIEGRGCFTIEKAFDEQANSDVVDFCQNIIASFLNKEIKKVVLRKKTIRYFAYTINDYNILSRLQRQRRIKNLITPDYLSYGRDQKIYSVIDQLHAL